MPVIVDGETDILPGRDGFIRRFRPYGPALSCSRLPTSIVKSWWFGLGLVLVVRGHPRLDDGERAARPTMVQQFLAYEKLLQDHGGYKRNSPPPKNDLSYRTNNPLTKRFLVALKLRTHAGSGWRRVKNRASHEGCFRVGPVRPTPTASSGIGKNRTACVADPLACLRRVPPGPGARVHYASAKKLSLLISVIGTNSSDDRIALWRPRPITTCNSRARPACDGRAAAVR